MKKINYLLYCIFIITLLLNGCAGVADYVTRDVNLSIVSNNKLNNIIIYQPYQMPKKIKNKKIEYIKKLYEKYENNDITDNNNQNRIYKFYSQNTDINIYLRGHLRGGLVWIIPPLGGMFSDFSSTIFFNIGNEIYAFNSKWKEENYTIYKVNTDNKMLLLTENEYNNIFLIKYFVNENKRIDEIGKQKLVDNIIIELK